jgi:hypothetical protein
MLDANTTKSPRCAVDKWHWPLDANRPALVFDAVNASGGGGTVHFSGEGDSEETISTLVEGPECRQNGSDPRGGINVLVLAVSTVTRD